MVRGMGAAVHAGRGFSGFFCDGLGRRWCDVSCECVGGLPLVACVSHFVPNSSGCTSSRCCGDRCRIRAGYAGVFHGGTGVCPVGILVDIPDRRFATASENTGPSSIRSATDTSSASVSPDNAYCVQLVVALCSSCVHCVTAAAAAAAASVSLSFGAVLGYAFVPGCEWVVCCHYDTSATCLSLFS